MDMPSLFPPGADENTPVFVISVAAQLNGLMRWVANVLITTFAICESWRHSIIARRAATTNAVGSEKTRRVFTPG